MLEPEITTPMMTVPPIDSGNLRKKLNRFRASLARFFVLKQDIVDCMLIAAIAGEPLLLVGPPGTAKSELILKFCEALDLQEADYFEYMLTRFTEPGEILGPIDIQELREGRYVRREAGKLPTARVAFLDEIFKSNSAILNVLLTILNEGKFYQDGRPQPVALEMLFAATNELPEHAELAALNDRFTLKVLSRSVAWHAFGELIEAGLQNERAQAENRRPWAEGLASLDDILQARQFLASQFRMADSLDNSRKQDRQFPEDVVADFRRILFSIMHEEGVFVSDRKVVKLYKLLRARAWLLHGGAVTRNDLLLLRHVGNSTRELEVLDEKIPQILGIEFRPVAETAEPPSSAET